MNRIPIGSTVRPKPGTAHPQIAEMPSSMMIFDHADDDSDQVECVWADGTATQRHWFNEDSLEIIEAGPDENKVDHNQLLRELQHSEDMARAFGPATAYGYLDRAIHALMRQSRDEWRIAVQANTSKRSETMANRFAIGTVVRLKSGGPNMTVKRQSVEGSEDHPMIECLWFDNEDGDLRYHEGNPILNDPRTAWFPEASLELVN